MEVTNCLLNSNANNCRGPKRKHINMVMCNRHLEEFFGLEMGFVVHETEMSHKYVGGFLKPKKGVVFQRNTVLFPTQEFFDRYYRPEDVNLMNVYNTAKFKMNPVLDEMMRFLSSGSSEEKSGKRYLVEIIRNMVIKADLLNSGPAEIQKFLFKNMIQLIASKITFTETSIKTQAISSHLDTMQLWQNDRMVQIKDLNFTKIMEYILFNCLFAEHLINHEQQQYTDNMMYNVEWVDKIGLVTTESIGDPMFLVVHGISSGSQSFYNALVSTVKKDVVQRKTTLNDLPTQFHINDSFRGGSPGCTY